MLDEREEVGVAIVAHGTVISLLVARHDDIEAFEFWRRLGLPSFCVLSVSGFGLRKVDYELGPET